MAYTPYYAPYSRPMGYYNPSMPQQDTSNMQTNQIPVQQPIPQMPIQTPAPFMQAQPTNDMIWVLGQTEAESYLVAPNNSVVLWDKNNPTIYIKSVNAQGMPSMRVLDFTERNTDTSKSAQNSRAEHTCTCGDKFATKEKIVEIEAKISELEGKYEAMAEKSADGSKKKANKPKEVEE